MHRPTGGRFGQPRTPNTANQLPLPAYRHERFGGSLLRLQHECRPAAER